MSSLATRCTECGTVFRVVPDQLRVSDGWVRCGRCTAVFNAVENFVELDTRLPAATSAPAAAAAALPPRPPPPPPEPEAASTVADPAPTLDHLHSAFHRYEDDADSPPADAEAERFGFAPAESSAATDTYSDADPRAEADARTAPLPRFVRQADRAARWRSRPLRAAAATLSVLLAAALLGQMALTWRDRLAAEVPALEPALVAACGVLECTVGPARSIADLGVEASGLLRVEKSSLYRLSLTLRNRADIALALPALDLSLTDSDGRLVARRVLRAAELGLASSRIAAGQDLPVQAVLQLDREAPTVSGYTVELFYP
jgi:predicted Zn finger-like uncharacterized protein